MSSTSMWLMVRHQDGTITGIRSLARDVTDRPRAVHAEPIVPWSDWTHTVWVTAADYEAARHAARAAGLSRGHAAIRVAR